MRYYLELWVLKSFLLLVLQLFSAYAGAAENWKLDSLELSAEISFKNRELRQSKELRIQALNLSKDIENWEGVVRNLSYLYILALIDDNLNEAESLLDSASLYCDSYLKNEDLAYYKLLGLKGFQEKENSNYSKSIGYLEVAIQGIEILEDEPTDLLHNVYNLLDVYRYKGEYEMAIRISEKYLLHIDKYSKSFDQFQEHKARLTAGIGFYLFEMQKYKRSFEFLTQANYEAGKIQSKRLRSILIRNNYKYISDIYLSANKFEDALTSINKAINFSELQSTKQNPSTLNQKVKILIEHGELFEAESNAIICLENFIKKKIRKRKEEAIYISSLGHILYLQNKLDSAQHYLDLAADLVDIPLEKNLNTFETYLTVPNFNTNTILILSRIAALDLTLYENSGDKTCRENALKRYQQAFNGAKFLQKELSSKSAKIQLNRAIQKHFSNYLDILLDMYAESPDWEIYTAIAQLIEDNKAIVLKQDVYEKNLKLKANLPQELLDQELSVQEQMNTLNRKIKKHKVQEGEEGIIDEWKSELLDLKYQEKDIQKQIEQDYPEYYNSKYTLQHIDLDGVKNSLDKGDMYLNYYRSDSLMICAWMTKSDYGIKVISDLEIVDKDMEQLINISRNDPAQGFSNRDFQTFKNASHKLHQTLLPVEKITAFASNYLIISPTHQLNYFPFEILVTANDENASSFKSLDYLVKSTNIEYASSTELWLNSQKSERDELNSIVSLAPFVGEGKATNRSALGDEDLANLPCSDDEVESIAGYYAHTPLKGLSANKEVFATLGKHDIIHLATHAIVDETSPELNRLMFHDDYLDIQDLETMNLDAKLAVLSACNTGSGALRSGEGVINLGKGFRSAGVPSFVTSLWSINDCATASIVDHFYSQLNNENLSSALRLAKLDYLSSADKLTAHPYYWSGLVFSGNKDVFTKASSNIPWKYISIGMLGIFLVLFGVRRTKKSN